MILDSILNILCADEVLKGLLGATVMDSKIHMFSTSDGISYRWTQLTSDKIKEQNRLEITVVDMDYEKAQSITSRVKTLLITLADQKLNNDIYEILQNGGGCIENQDTKAIMMKTIFIVKNKYREVN